MPDHVLALPSSAVILPEVPVSGRDDVAALRRDVTAAILLPAVAGGAIVVAATDPAAEAAPCWVAPTADVGLGRVHLGGLGLRGTTALVSPPEDAGDLQAVDAAPGPDLGVLAALASRLGGASVTLLALPSRCSTPQAQALAAHLAWADLLICAGDLSAGHGPKPPRPEVGDDASRTFDRLVAGALEDLDVLPAVLARGTEVAARGGSSVLLAGVVGARHGLPLTSAATHVVDGVGSLVARWG